MAPQPKRRISRTRARKKRSHHALGRLQFMACSNPDCDAYVLPHQGCMVCGTYRGRQFIEEIEDEE